MTRSRKQLDKRLKKIAGGKNHWVLEERPSKSSVVLSVLDYVRPKLAQILVYHGINLPAAGSDADIETLLKGIYGEDFKVRSVRENQIPYAYLQRRSETEWVLQEPVEPIEELMAIAKSIAGTPGTELEYRGIKIPVAEVLEAYQTFTDKQRYAINSFKTYPQETPGRPVGHALEGGRAFGRLSSYLGWPYRLTWDHVRCIDSFFVKQAPLKTAFDQGFCETLRDTGDKECPNQYSPRTEEMIDEYFKAVAVRTYS